MESREKSSRELDGRGSDGLIVASVGREGVKVLDVLRVILGVVLIVGDVRYEWGWCVCSGEVGN